MTDSICPPPLCSHLESSDAAVVSLSSESRDLTSLTGACKSKRFHSSAGHVGSAVRAVLEFMINFASSWRQCYITAVELTITVITISHHHQQNITIIIIIIIIIPIIIISLKSWSYCSHRFPPVSICVEKI